MDKKLDEILREALKAEQSPEPYVNRRIFTTWEKENQTMKKHYFGRQAAAAVIAGILFVGGTVTYAAYRYLSPAEIAGKLTEADAPANALAKAFESKDAILLNETQQSNGYDITLLGLVSGAELSPYVSAEVQQQVSGTHTYAAIAISRSDGADMENDGKCISPLINGVKWQTANNATLNTTNYWFEKEGIVYHLIECDNLEIFAGRGVQIGVVDSFGNEGSAFVMNESTGVYQKAEGYTGTNALFQIPLDTAKGDEEAAQAYIEKLEEKMQGSSENSSEQEEEIVVTDVKEINDFYILWWNAESDAEFLETYAQPIEGSKQTLTVGKDGSFSYASEEGGEGTLSTEGMKIGEPVLSNMGAEDTLDSVRMNVFTLNEDGTVTYEVYRVKE